MNTILKLSQLTTLIIEKLEFDKATPFVEGTFHLTNLETFGLMFDGKPMPQLERLGDFVIGSGSRKLRKIIVSEGILRKLSPMKLPKLQTLSAFGTRPYFHVQIRPILLEIIESPVRTIEILELVGMEYYTKRFTRDSIDRDRMLWEHSDRILQDPAFSRLREIRLLFDYTAWESEHSLQDCVEEDSCIRCSIDQVAVDVRSILRATSERGVRITYDLTYGPEGLLSIQ
ncbi:hypothetical protein GALMADRAFT_232253 [Galerina marginata CBS 339.88]|uniref:Uncharacterized protein n=1 Tax=Galerina marginata (strain CBS 339.88) TaxID=685588 RepID=A0A067S8A2_GALM3|nr:hypothetical protein GALMADRAFT_232253 [Galerina marginata CBS 339.88]